MRRSNIILGLMVMLGVLSACQQQQRSAVPSQVKVGKPYVVNGKTYYPEFDDTYDRTGTASWYGPGFHNKKTANGEVFDQNDLTAAHPTLPMPSIVRVTNLENGKSLIVRINDRGPFKKNRIIDLSKRSAERLGITSLAQVRVQFLQKETQEYMASVQRGSPMEVAEFNDRPPSATIVESTVASSAGGQPVFAAPVMTVNSNEIAGGPPADQTPASGDVTIVNEAWADNSATIPAPVDTTPINIVTPVKPPTLTQEEAAPIQPAPIEVAKAEPPKPTTPSSPAPSTVGDYVIQAGSFSSEDNAHKLAKKLSAVFDTMVEKIITGNKTWWRVRVGPFNDRQLANDILNKVRNSVPDARIVRL